MYDANAYYSGIMMNGVLKNNMPMSLIYMHLNGLKVYTVVIRVLNFQNRPIFMSRAGAPGIQRFGCRHVVRRHRTNLGA